MIPAAICLLRSMLYTQLWETSWPSKGDEDEVGNPTYNLGFLGISSSGSNNTGTNAPSYILPPENPSSGYMSISSASFLEEHPNHIINGCGFDFIVMKSHYRQLTNFSVQLTLEDAYGANSHYPDKLRYLSREEKNKNGGKMYVEDKIKEFSDE
ncbi:hypothetical protein Ccrd_024935, partial [Cynara cardunculus var. scolymus]